MRGGFEVNSFEINAQVTMQSKMGIRTTHEIHPSSAQSVIYMAYFMRNFPSFLISQLHCSQCSHNRPLPHSNLRSQGLSKLPGRLRAVCGIWGSFCADLQDLLVKGCQRWSVANADERHCGRCNQAVQMLLIINVQSARGLIHQH